MNKDLLAALFMLLMAIAVAFLAWLFLQQRTPEIDPDIGLAIPELSSGRAR
jgi:hypothetical protein